MSKIISIKLAIAGAILAVRKYEFNKPASITTDLEKLKGKALASKKRVLKRVPIMETLIDDTVATANSKRDTVHTKYDALIEKIEARRQKHIDAIQEVKRTNLKNIEEVKRTNFLNIEEEKLDFLMKVLNHL